MSNATETRPEEREGMMIVGTHGFRIARDGSTYVLLNKSGSKREWIGRVTKGEHGWHNDLFCTTYDTQDAAGQMLYNVATFTYQGRYFRYVQA